MRRRTVIAVLAAGACGAPAASLYRAGAREDEGNGELAQASAKLLILEDESVFAIAARKPPERRLPVVDDDLVAYGGDPYGANPYGGMAYAGYTAPRWAYRYTNRLPTYNVVNGLSGSVEGTISWRGAIPAKRKTECGAKEVAAIGPERGVGDTLVYIASVQTGRPLQDGKPASVGGIVVKRDCALVPAVQIVTPLPAALSIHSDGKPSKLTVTGPNGPGRTFELEPAGRNALEVEAGITQIDSADRSHSSAWVHALETSYYAITDDQGRFRIDELAPGNYELTIWHAPIFVDGKYGQPLVVKRTVRVETKKSTRLDVAIGP